MILGVFFLFPGVYIIYWLSFESGRWMEKKLTLSYTAGVIFLSYP